MACSDPVTQDPGPDAEAIEPALECTPSQLEPSGLVGDLAEAQRLELCEAVASTAVEADRMTTACVVGAVATGVFTDGRIDSCQAHEASCQPVGIRYRCRVHEIAAECPQAEVGDVEACLCAGFLASVDVMAGVLDELERMDGELSCEWLDQGKADSLDSLKMETPIECRLLEKQCPGLEGLFAPAGLLGAP